MRASPRRPMARSLMKSPLPPTCAASARRWWSRPTVWQPARACGGRHPRGGPRCRARVLRGCLWRGRIHRGGGGVPHRSGVLAARLHRRQDRVPHGHLAGPQARLEGDRGPNTGGMGVYSPVPIVTDDELAEMQRIMDATVAELAAEASITAVACTAASCLRPRAPRCSSSTRVSAIPRPRWCCRALRTIW